MKKLMVLLMVLLLTACGGADSQDYTTLCNYISGEIQPGPGGWYEVVRHTNDTIDIVFTDISTATRAPVGGDTTLPVAHGAAGGIFVTENSLYYYDGGFPQAMGITQNPQTLYCFTLDGVLTDTVTLPQTVNIPLSSAVVSDGQKLYFIGDTAYSFDTDSFVFEEINWDGTVPAAAQTSGGYILVPDHSETVYLNNGFYKITDVHYSIIKEADYTSGKNTFMPVENHIEYR